jgi:hypothetical protein
VLTRFDRYVAADWSGAKGPGLPGLQVAECTEGTLAPTLVFSPTGRRWTRSDLAQWLALQLAGNKRLLFGLDFGFAYPFCDRQAYFTDHPKSPAGKNELWECIETVCKTDEQFYGGSFYLRSDAPFADYLLCRTYRGKKFSSHRLRITEKACGASGASPTCMFKCVGPDSVGVGSIAGMRFLHHLKINFRDRVAIWPFDDISLAGCVIVEVFPRLYFRLACENPRQWRDPRVLNATLGHFGSEPPTPATTFKREDEVDAVITSAALRSLAQERQYWRPHGMTGCAGQYEGWIFGVP